MALSIFPMFFRSCSESPSAHSSQLGLLLKSEQLVCKLLQSPTSEVVRPGAVDDVLSVLDHIIKGEVFEFPF